LGTCIFFFRHWRSCLLCAS